MRGKPGKGTGLGLFIVRQIVERNKGRISLERVVGLGLDDRASVANRQGQGYDLLPRFPRGESTACRRGVTARDEREKYGMS